LERNSTAEILIATRIGGIPASSQARPWRQPSRSTHLPSGTTKPDSSAIVMNLSGWHESANRMSPADQHLGADDLLGDQVDASLIVQHELLAIDRAAQVALDFLALDQMQVICRSKNRYVLALLSLA
jgi:hypothetical protein